MADFLPVLLGSDANVYGMARSFYMEYGVPSLAIGKGRLAPTANSKLVQMAVVEPGLENDEVFRRTLTGFAAAHPGKTLVLVSCGDNYTGLMARSRAALEPFYKFACPTPELVEQLDTKEFFYHACRAHGLSYPQTFGCTNQNYKTVELPFAFPCIIKPSNSVAYWNCRFPHKKKVFVAYSKEEFNAITAAIYSSSYQDNLVLQEYIPGDDNCMRANYVFATPAERNKYLKKHYHDKAPEEFFKPYFDQVRGLDEPTQLQWVDMHTWMLYDILLKADRMSMANSLELRVPFLDKEMLELALSIPSRYRAGKTETKIALRRAALGQLPESVAKRKKLGFPVPLNDWLRQDKYYHMVRQAFEGEVAAQFFNVPELLRLLDEHKAGKNGGMTKIWSFYSFILWYEQFFVLR